MGTRQCIPVQSSRGLHHPHLRLSKCSPNRLSNSSRLTVRRKLLRRVRPRVRRRRRRIRIWGMAMGQRRMPRALLVPAPALVLPRARRRRLRKEPVGERAGTRSLRKLNQCAMGRRGKAEGKAAMVSTYTVVDFSFLTSSALPLQNVVLTLPFFSLPSSRFGLRFGGEWWSHFSLFKTTLLLFLMLFSSSLYACILSMKCFVSICNA